MLQQARIVSPVAWLSAPDWLSVDEACYLSGWDQDSMLEIIADGGVDLNLEGLVEKRSLWEFQECLALVLHWDD